MNGINENGGVATTQHPPTNTIKHGNYNSTSSITYIELIKKILNFVDSHDRDIWVKCGMAIKEEHGDAGFSVWDEWSARADNYDKSAAIRTWKSFKRGGGVKIGTLIQYAKDNGYKHDSDYKPIPLTDEQLAAREAEQEKAYLKLDQVRAKAAIKASEIWKEPKSALEAFAPSISEHPYIVKKGIKPFGAKVYRGSLNIGGMVCNGALMIPIYSGKKIASLQFINGEGEKRFLPNGEKGYFSIGRIEEDKPVCIAEGYATAATIHEATGHTVIIAFDCHNMIKVTGLLRSNYPNIKIILCADDDEHGLGVKCAAKAAIEFNALVAMPVLVEVASHE